MKKNIVLVLLLMGLSGCSSELNQFVDACMATSNMGEEICQCAAGKAKEKLSGEGFSLLIATLQEDREKVQKLRESMAIGEIMEVGMFMVTAPAGCAVGPQSN